MSNTHQPSTYWRSLGELYDSPEFRAQLEAEFPVPEEATGFSRRRMLQLLGASMVLATAGSCRWKEREVLPFAKRPQNRTPGKFERYATAMELGGSVLGLMVTCVDGRPIKIEGNPKHPNSLGATNAYAQAAILELYDPDRSRHIIEKTSEGDMVRSWEQFSEFAKKHFEEYRKNGGEGLAVISEIIRSPTVNSLRRRFLSDFPKAKWCIYEPVEQAFYAPHQLDKAEVVLCVEDDIFGTNPHSVKYIRDFMKNRNLGNGKMKRLYVVESSYSITGAMADHRLAIPASDFVGFAEKLLRENPKRRAVKKVGELETEVDRFLAAFKSDVQSHPESTVVIFGDMLSNEYKSSNSLRTLESLDSLKWLGLNITAAETNSHDKQASEDEREEVATCNLEQLVESFEKEEIRSLWIFGGNPAFDAPVDYRFSECFGKVPQRVHLSNYHNETSQECTWHLPKGHFLESWRDLLSSDRSYSVVQPMIEPLNGGRSEIEILLLALQNDPARVPEEIRNQFKRLTGEKDFDERWRKLLHDGCAKIDRIEMIHSPEIPQFDTSKQTRITDNLLEITFRPSPAVYDGRFANLSWLQEMPHPITRLTWDNVALFSPATAEKLGLKHEEIVKLKFKGREIEIAAYILPGQADGSVAVTLGYGRTAAGKVGGSEKDGIPPVGVNTYKLRTSDAMYFGTGLTVEPTGRMHPLASVAEHFAINQDSIGEKGRKERLGELVRETPLEEYQKQAKDAKEPEHEKSLWKEFQYNGHRWGLAVDLSKCVGCGACVVACMAENNVPVVGKERIFKNREMHWLRVDRYFRGDVNNPQIVFQPVMCQHCEMAPCEGVCPVGATAHSSEGLNEMVYNRCVGTRYCANNCPYKVRRFNFFNYHKQYEDPENEVLKMASNPQVTVRMRGVMEKCTYCVQRIQAVKIEAKNEKRLIADGEIKTACQQVCPAGAIVFGDLNDKNSEVCRCFENNRSYTMLDELHTKPRTAYLERIRNPNPELEKTE